MRVGSAKCTLALHLTPNWCQMLLNCAPSDWRLRPARESGRLSPITERGQAVVRGYSVIAVLSAALLALPAGARDRADVRPTAPAASIAIRVDSLALLMAEAAVHGAERGAAAASRASIPVDSRSMLMAGATVYGDAAAPVASGLPGLPRASARFMVALLPRETATMASGIALPHVSPAHAGWELAPLLPTMTQRETLLLDRTSLEATTDHLRKRRTGVDARLELRIDGNEDSAMLRLGGRLAGAIRSLERR